MAFGEFAYATIWTYMGVYIYIWVPVGIYSMYIYIYTIQWLEHSSPKILPIVTTTYGNYQELKTKTTEGNGWTIVSKGYCL